MKLRKAQAKARAWIERLDSDAHWARTPLIRAEAMEQADVLRSLLDHLDGGL